MTQTATSPAATKPGFLSRTKARWKRIGEFASHAREDRRLFLMSAAVAIIYNLLGGLDIISTIAGLRAQLGEEANPFIRLLMEKTQDGWIPAKLALQLFVTWMILWFPHRFVLAIFSIAMVIMAGVIVNNLAIAGVW